MTREETKQAADLSCGYGPTVPDDECLPGIKDGKCCLHGDCELYAAEVASLRAALAEAHTEVEALRQEIERLERWRIIACKRGIALRLFADRLNWSGNLWEGGSVYPSGQKLAQEFVRERI